MFGGHDDCPTERKFTPKSEPRKSSQKYTPNSNDVRIVAGEDVLIITDDKMIGGLWAGVDDYDSCSVSEQECYDKMNMLIKENFEEACDALLFKLDEHQYLVNIADCINRGPYDELGPLYLHLCEDLINVFYPIIKHFVDTRSDGKNVGFVNLCGGGTSIAISSLVEKFKADGYNCFVEIAVLPFQERKSLYAIQKCRSCLLDFEYEKFDCQPYLNDSSLADFFAKDVFVVLDAMKDRVIKRMANINLRDNSVDVPVIACPEYKKLSEYGYIRTIADIIKVLNETKSYTSPKVLIADLYEALEPYRERGTVSQSSIDAVRCLIHDNSSYLFSDQKLDINKLARIIDKIPSEGKNAIDRVFSIRQKAKILYAVKFANRICKYTNSNNLIYDLQGLFWGNSNWGWHTKLLDDVHPHMDNGVRFFLECVEKAWPSITSKDNTTGEMTLNNDLLESYMFTDHEKKIKEKGLVSTLKEDYEEVPGCHSARLMPKRPGSGPVYLVDDNKEIQRACHPSDDTLIQQEFYECGFIEVLIKNMMARHEYREVEGDRSMYYLPVKDYSCPIYDGRYHEMSFDTEEQRMKFIESFNKG